MQESRPEKYTNVNVSRILWILIAVYFTWSQPVWLLFLTLGFLCLAILWLGVTEVGIVDELRFPRWAYLPTFVDISVASVYLLFTGTVNSPLVLAFIYTTAVCSLNPRVKQGRFATVYGSVAYAVVSTAAYLGVLPTTNILGAPANITLTNLVFGIVIFSLANTALHLIISRLMGQNTALIANLQEETNKAVELKEKAEASNRAKRQFLANVSHEIRTPMNGVLGQTQLLDETPLNAEQKRLVRGISESAHSLLGMINEILDFSRIEAGKLRIEQRPFDVRTILRGAVDTLLQVRARNLQILVEHDADVPPMVLADPLRLRQVLINLLHNAVKFTPDGGRVEIRCRRVAPDFLEVWVRDTGPGIPANMEKKIFEAFEQVPGQGGVAGGTGLGLAIVQRLVDLMGGDIRLHREAGWGAVFSFRIKAPAHDLIADATNAPDAPVFSGHALVVDDVDMNAMIVKKFLEKFGFSADTSSSGEEALDHLARSSYDIVFMDLQMPGMGGLEATRALRASSLPQPLVIALTANAYPEDREAAIAAGMNDFLTKPITREALAELLRRHMTN